MKHQVKSKMGYARRKITGKHGHSLKWFEAKYYHKDHPLSKSAKAKALREYKAQVVK